MAAALIDLKEIRVTGTATVLAKPGAVKLDDYPLLVYAPRQHGDGIRTEDSGAAVAEIATAAAETPDLAALAARFGTTTNHVVDAIRYALDAGYASA
jgi:hypothetical protein